ncbi:hypothetical protein SNEBB_007302 [Seison nebaliae]|nr:hypothetical protein SNEBB_007302 [Seison nebaliae]
MANIRVSEQLRNCIQNTVASRRDFFLGVSLNKQNEQNKLSDINLKKESDEMKEIGGMEKELNISERLSDFAQTRELIKGKLHFSSNCVKEEGDSRNVQSKRISLNKSSTNCGEIRQRSRSGEKGNSNSTLSSSKMGEMKELLPIPNEVNGSNPSKSFCHQHTIKTNVLQLSIGDKNDDHIILHSSLKCGNDRRMSMNEENDNLSSYKLATNEIDELNRRIYDEDEHINHLHTNHHHHHQMKSIHTPDMKSILKTNHSQKLSERYENNMGKSSLLADIFRCISTTNLITTFTTVTSYQSNLSSTTIKDMMTGPITTAAIPSKLMKNSSSSSSQSGDKYEEINDENMMNSKSESTTSEHIFDVVQLSLTDGDFVEMGDGLSPKFPKNDDYGDSIATMLNLTDEIFYDSGNGSSSNDYTFSNRHVNISQYSHQKQQNKPSSLHYHQLATINGRRNNEENKSNDSPSSVYYSSSIDAVGLSQSLSVNQSNKQNKLINNEEELYDLIMENSTNNSDHSDKVVDNSPFELPPIHQQSRQITPIKKKKQRFDTFHKIYDHVSAGIRLPKNRSSQQFTTITTTISSPISTTISSSTKGTISSNDQSSSSSRSTSFFANLTGTVGRKRSKLKSSLQLSQLEQSSPSLTLNDTLTKSTICLTKDVKRQKSITTNNRRNKSKRRMFTIDLTNDSILSQALQLQKKKHRTPTPQPPPLPPTPPSISPLLQSNNNNNDGEEKEEMEMEKNLFSPDSLYKCLPDHSCTNHRRIQRTDEERINDNDDDDDDEYRTYEPLKKLKKKKNRRKSFIDNESMKVTEVQHSLNSSNNNIYKRYGNDDENYDENVPSSAYVLYDYHYHQQSKRQSKLPMASPGSSYLQPIQNVMESTPSSLMKKYQDADLSSLSSMSSDFDEDKIHRNFHCRTHGNYNDEEMRNEVPKISKNLTNEKFSIPNVSFDSIVKTISTIRHKTSNLLNRTSIEHMNQIFNDNQSLNRHRRRFSSTGTRRKKSIDKSSIVYLSTNVSSTYDYSTNEADNDIYRSSDHSQTYQTTKSIDDNDDFSEIIPDDISKFHSPLSENKPEYNISSDLLSEVFQELNLSLNEKDRINNNNQHNDINRNNNNNNTIPQQPPSQPPQPPIQQQQQPPPAPPTQSQPPPPPPQQMELPMKPPTIRNEGRYGNDTNRMPQHPTDVPSTRNIPVTVPQLHLNEKSNRAQSPPKNFRSTAQLNNTQQTTFQQHQQQQQRSNPVPQHSNPPLQPQIRYGQQQQQQQQQQQKPVMKSQPPPPPPISSSSSSLQMTDMRHNGKPAPQPPPPNMSYTNNNSRQFSNNNRSSITQHRPPPTIPSRPSRPPPEPPKRTAPKHSNALSSISNSKVTESMSPDVVIEKATKRLQLERFEFESWESLPPSIPYADPKTNCLYPSHKHRTTRR